MSESRIDFVLPWVDGNDPEWQAEKAQYDGTAVMANSNTVVRFRDWNNLQYWFRGVERFAPWVNKIHFITWGHLPPWLNTDHPKLHIVNHRDYIPQQYLPTFNANTIELNLNRIEGLADRFVYFNDDMFLTDKTDSSVFFQNGRPCDTFGLNCIYFAPDSAGHFNGSNVEVINAEFKNKKEIIRKNFAKWYSPKNGFRNNMKTALLSGWDWFPGFHYNHLPSNFLKSTLDTVWEKYGDVLDKTCRDKFRREYNVTQWLFKYWQLCDGTSVPRKECGKCWQLKDEDITPLCDDIRGQRYKIICINDTSLTTDFEQKSEAVRQSFQSILPEKSAFEK